MADVPTDITVDADGEWRDHTQDQKHMLRLYDELAAKLDFKLPGTKRTGSHNDVVAIYGADTELAQTLTDANEVSEFSIGPIPINSTVGGFKRPHPGPVLRLTVQREGPNRVKIEVVIVTK